MKRKLLIILSILSTLAVTGWLITEFYGGMVIYMFMYWWIIVPLIIIYAITLIITLIKIIRNGIKFNKFLFYTHIFGVLMIIIFSLHQSELFKSRILLDATMVDDLSSINLVLRENGKFETTTNGLFGFTDKISGEYLIHNDTIIFLKRPYSNNFIPDKVLIDKEDSAIYFKMNSKGEFSREKTFVNYFRIEK